MLASIESFQEFKDLMIKLGDQKVMNQKKEYMTINSPLAKILCKEKRLFIKFTSHFQEKNSYSC